jgi:hypothetical protein
MVKRNFRRKQRSSDPEMVGQRRPTGTFKTATVKWKLKVMGEMVDLGMTRAELSRRLKKLTGTGSAQAIKDLLGPIGTPVDQLKDSSTKLMPAIHQVFGWPPPADEEGEEKSEDILQSRFNAIFPDLSQTEREFIEMLVAKRTRKP